MEVPSFVVISSEHEQNNLEHKVDEVGQNVDNLSKQQVEQKETHDTEMEREEKDEKHGQKNIELQTGYKILKDLMADSNKNVNWPFMDPIEVSAPNLVDDYHEKIEKPVWLKLMREKFMKFEYTSITEFVSDFRLMLENCYRYNGPDHYVSKRGQKLETMLEQKLALLSRELRAKTSITATSGHMEENTASTSLGLRRRQRTMPRHDSTLLLNQLREEELQREREYRRQIIMDRKAEKEALALEVLDWEEKILFQGKYKPQMEAMWELPQIGLFLFLCQVPLNVGEIMQLELERCIMMPRESSTMQLIMTSLLSTPFQRQKIDKRKLMPYKIWNEKLRTRLQQWYKIYLDSGMDAEKACVKLGFEPDFFTVVGEKNPMERKRFHEVSFYRRVWIVKGLCDYCMQTQDYLRETVEIQPFQDQREYMLGTDADGWRYLHFPQFCGADVRIYRQAPITYPKIEIKPDPFDMKRKFPLRYKPPPIKKQKVVKKKKKEKKRKMTPPVSPVTFRLRPAGLRQTPKTVVPLQLIDSSTSSSESLCSSDDDGDEAGVEIQGESVDNGADTYEDTNDATDVNDEGTDKGESETDPAMSEDEKKSGDGHSTGSDATIPYCDNSCSDSVSSSRSCSRASSPCFTQDSVSQDSRFDSSRENSGSPMRDRLILRKFRKGTRLKELPNSRAARNLNSFLFMEDSNSRSSDCGESSNSGIAGFRGKFDLKDILLEENENSSSSKLDLKDILLEENENSSSSGMCDNSNSCDMKDLFKNSSVDAETLNSAINEGEQDKLADETRSEEDMETTCGDKEHTHSSDSMDMVSSVEQTKAKQSYESIVETPESEIDGPVSENTNQNNNQNIRLLNSLTCEENKDIICNGSHDPVSLKNSNGYVSITESLKLERCKIIESEGEFRNDTLCTENLDEHQVVENCIDKETCEEQGNISNEISMHNGVENDSFKEENMEIDCKEELKEKTETESVTEQEDSIDYSMEGTEFVSVKQEPSDYNAQTECIKTEKDEESHGNEINDIFNEPSVNEVNGISEATDVKTEPSGNEVNGIFDTSEVKTETSGNEVNGILDTSEVKTKTSGNQVKGISDNAEVKTEPSNNEEKNISDNTEVKSQPFGNGVQAISDTTEVKTEPSGNEVKGISDNTEVKREPTGNEVNGISYTSEVKIEGSTEVKMEPSCNEVKGISDTNEVKTEGTTEVKMEITDAIKTEVKEEEKEEEELTPDMESFQLIVDSVEGLRELTRQFAEPEPIIIKRGKKEQVTKPPPRKRCVVLLYNRLSYLLKELEPWEAKLTQATKRARIKLRKEVEDYVEKEEENPTSWDTDEETESGSEVSDHEHETDAEKRTKATSSPVKLRGRNSECSTPVKFDESIEDIDISQRGRLRKRRIIPNNAEDQNPVKKSKLSVKSETLPSAAPQQPLVVQRPVEGAGQAGKILIGYSELIKQLKAANPSALQGTNSPILLQTSQGGKVLVTSIVPSGNNSQKLRFVPPFSASATQSVPITMVTSTTSTSVKQSQHPTIQHLLTKPQTSDLSSGMVTSAAAVSNSPGLRHILPQTTAIIPGVTPSVIMRHTSPGTNQQPAQKLTSPRVNQQPAPVNTPIILKQNTTPQKILTAYPLTPHKTEATNQISNIVVPAPQVTTLSMSAVPTATVSPQAVTIPSETTNMGAVSKGKVKYYAANASTLPINVVQQLLATRGAKLQTGPNQQSILYIPMESEGSSRSVISVTKAVTQTSSVVPQVETKLIPSQSVTSSTTVSVPLLTVSQTLGSQSVNNLVKVVTTQTVSNVTLALSSVSLPAVNTVSSCNKGPELSTVSLASQTISSLTQALQIQTTDLATNGSNVKPGDMSGSSVASLKPVYFSPPKYPTNETVRTLLFKRKSSSEEKVKHPLQPESLEDKIPPKLRQFQGPPYLKISPKPANIQPVNATNPISLQQISSNQILGLTRSSANQILAPTLTLSTPNSGLGAATAQQCVFTSISASKLNTLLLQTSAAGAKSIPSLIKLPSKAALDSAVKAVVTSVNVTLPTVNIKVPSPTSLPSIGPRRNVTKTIQTMKSPIPVAPKVVTMSSGSVLGTTMSGASSNMLVSSAATPLVSVAGQSVGLGSNLIPTGQVPSSALPVVTLASQSSGIMLKGLDLIRAQLGPGAIVSLASQPQVGPKSTTSSPLIYVSSQANGQSATLVQSSPTLSKVVQNLEGKNVVTKMIPQTILTSQGLVQGFVTPQGIVIPQSKKTQNQSSALASSSVTHSGILATKQSPVSQSVKITSPQPQALVSPNLKNINSPLSSVGRPNVAPPPLQLMKAPTGTSQLSANVIQAVNTANTPRITVSVADNQSRSTMPVIMPVSQLNSPAMTTVATAATPIQSSQQPGKFIFPPNLSGLQLATSTSMSPMINLPQGLLMPGTANLPVASPVLNQLGIPFLQQGMTVQSPGVLQQNLNLLQTSLNPSGLQQLVSPVILTPGMISPQVLNQSPGLQLQGVKTESLQQNNLIPLSNQIPTSVPNAKASGNGNLSSIQLPSGQVIGSLGQVGTTISGVNADILKQVNAAALVKQMASSQLQSKINVGNASLPDVKPILLQQQLNTPANQPSALKLASPSLIQNLGISNTGTQVQGNQVKLEGGRVISGLNTNMPKGFSTVTPQQPSDGQSILTPAQIPVTTLALTNSQMSASALAKLGSKTIAVNQITNEVVAPLGANPGTTKQAAGPSKVIAVNKISNKIENIYPTKLTPKVTAAQPDLIASQAKPLVIRPLKSPETVQNTATGSQQKIMLFSIGGQLVTQQGVPVTLENGVLKLMPQAIVQIANQTLTPKQIQQTLAKISQATIPAVSVSTPHVIPPPGSSSTMSISQSPVSLSSKLLANTQSLSIDPAVQDTVTQSRDHTYETPVMSAPKDLQHSTNISAKKTMRPLEKELENHYVTVQNITNTPGHLSNTTPKPGPSNVQFVLKPMGHSSGYIVCPRMSGVVSAPQNTESKVENSIATSVKMITSEQVSKSTTVSEKGERSLVNSENRLNVNGEHERIEDTDEGDDDDLSETKLVIDTNDQDCSETNKRQGSYTDKEAALNLLRLANQALGSSDEADQGLGSSDEANDKEMSNAGDAVNKLGR